MPNSPKTVSYTHLDVYKRQTEQVQELGLRLNMARGKPDAEQLKLSEGLWTAIDAKTPMYGEDGEDLRNYGLLCGTKEARKLMGEILHLDWEQVIVGGSSSLVMMYDAVMRGVVFGMLHSPEPWGNCAERKFLCPVPGYDRHFAITEQLGFTLVPVPMTDAGPDMELVEQLVQDKTVKGIWCVPKYSNPSGVTYSDETVRRLAAMKTAAPDFTVFWDNAYAIHPLYPQQDDTLADIFAYAQQYGTQDRILAFASTSKVTFPGAGDVYKRQAQSCFPCFENWTRFEQGQAAGFVCRQLAPERSGQIKEKVLSVSYSLLNVL